MSVPPSDTWAGVELRGPLDDQFAGTGLERRVEVCRVVRPRPGTVHEHLYAVDEEGELWLGARAAWALVAGRRRDRRELPWGAPVRHNSLVPRGARVHCAGVLWLEPGGSVRANCCSGHYMADAPLLPDEVSRWEAAMRATLGGAGLTPARLCPGVEEA